MTELNQRTYRLVLQDLEIGPPLDIDFHVERSVKPEVNKAEITIWNLSQAHRARLASFAGGVVCRLQAGYLSADPTQPGVGEPVSPESLPGLFLGSLREVTSLREGPHWQTHVSSGDGDGKDRPIQFSLGPGASLQAAIKRTIQELGIGIGNASKEILGGTGPGFLDGLGKTFAGGVVVSGPADKELERLLRSGGLEHSVQNGELQITRAGKPLNVPAIELTPDTGLVGSPEVGRDAEGQPLVRFRALMTSEIYPGRQVRVRSDTVDGYFRAESCSYLGSTYTNDWYVDVDGKPVK